MRKSTTKRVAVLPLGIKDRYQTELPALVALAAIGEPWFSGEHQADLLAIALVVKEMAPADSEPGQCAAELQRQCEQAILPEHKAEISLNLAGCLPWLQIQPNVRIQRALEKVMARHTAIAA